MRKILSTSILFIFLILITLITILSTIGIETKRFNNLFLKKINQNNDFNLSLKTIKFKLDIKEVSLFLETANLQLDYRDVTIPTKNIKVYIDFVSLLKSKPKIKKINLVLNQLDIEQLKKISTVFKPSNYNSLLNNKIKQGKLKAEINFYFDDNNLLDNFIARGSVLNLKTEITSDFNLEKTNFNFFADKSDILLSNIFGETGPFKISDGDLKLKLNSKISLETYFKTKLKYDNKFVNYTNLIKDYKYAKNLVFLEADLNNNFNINFDETYKVEKYDYNSSGKILKATLNFEKPLESTFLDGKINKLSLVNSEVKTSFNMKNNTTNISGKYYLNNDSPLLFNLENTLINDLLKFKLDADYSKPLELEFINYKKLNNSIANFSLHLEKQKDKLTIKKVKFSEQNNVITAEDINLKKDKFLSLKKISIKTNMNGKNNNDFSILYGKKIDIKGANFDASNLPKILNQKIQKNKFLNINKDIEIDFANVIAPLSENLKNFKLIGKIEKGKFIKISAKGDFGKNNFLDITMKKNKNDQKKYLEVYSDLTKPLLTEYSFFKGLTGGKLLYSSIIDGDKYNSKLKIENFNVINAPGMVKLLSLADLSGLADLAEGEGLSFDILEVSMEKKEDTLILNEVLALGPSISVLIEGYLNPEITSLRGTLIPAKTLNKMISKIPVLGSIIIPKEVGEGLFGISFKMKGPPGKIKTTINPIRTVTPRFIQKIIDRNN